MRGVPEHGAASRLGAEEAPTLRIIENTPARRRLTPAQKAECHTRENGVCYLCGKPVEVTGPNVHYDHKRNRWMTFDQGLENFFPVHWDPCHKAKTREEATSRAKVKRLVKKSDPELRKSKHPIKSAGFRRSTTHKRGLDGQVRPLTEAEAAKLFKRLVGESAGLSSDPDARLSGSWPERTETQDEQ